MPSHDSPGHQGHFGRQRRTQRMLNVRLLLGTLIAMAVLGPAAYCWHAYQLGRTSAALLEEAQRREDEGDWQRAAEYLKRYLQMYPDDAEVTVRWAETWDKSATGPGRKMAAVELFYRALGVAPAEKLPELRRRLAELQIELGQAYLDQKTRFVPAETVAKSLPSDDADGWRLLALALFHQLESGIRNTHQASQSGQTWEAGTIGEACRGMSIGDVFEKAHELDSSQSQLCFAWAYIHRVRPELLPDAKKALADDTRQAMADEIIDQMVTANRESLQACFIRYAKPLEARLQSLETEGDVGLADALAEIYEELRDADEELAQAQEGGSENKAVANVIAANRRYADALLTRYRYRIQHRLPGPKNDLANSLRHRPDNMSARIDAAKYALWEAQQASRDGGGSAGAARRFQEEAKRHYEYIIGQLAPRAPAAHLGLGSVYWAMGETERALEAWRFGLDNGDEEHIELNPSLADALVYIDLNMRLADALIGLGRLDEAKTTSETAAEVGPLNVLDRACGKVREQLRTIGAAEPRFLEEMRQLERSNNLLQARWLMAKGDYDASISRLKQVALGQHLTASELQENLRAHFLLARAHVGLQQWEEAALAFEAAASLQPDNVAARLGAASAWARVPNPEKAIRWYERAIRLADSAETRLALAQAHFQQQFALAQDARDWTPFQNALREVKQPSPDRETLDNAWRVALLEANYLVERAKESGDPPQENAQAATLLRDAENEHRQAVGLFQALPIVYRRLGLEADAKRAEAYAAVQSSLQQDVQQGRDRLLTLHETYPSHQGFVRQLAELAVELGDLPAAERWQKKVGELEGPESRYARYFRARWLLLLARSPEAPELLQAVQLQTEIQSEHPQWPEAYLLAGMILERRGKVPQAIDAYQQAVKRGESRVPVVMQLVQLLYQEQRFAEGDRYLARLQGNGPTAANLSALAISGAARRGDLGGALRIASREAEMRDDDPMAHVSLGQVLMANKEMERAEAEFLRAVELAPRDPRVVGPLVGFYGYTGQTELAHKALQTLAEDTGGPSLESTLVLARGYEAAGDFVEAEAHYRKAIELAPDDTALHVRLATLLGRTNLEEAEKILRNALQQAPDSGDARRALAALLARRGGEAAWQEATQLLANAGPVQSSSALDKHLRAVLFFQRGGRQNRQVARQLLEELIAESEEPAAGVHLLLARIYEAEDDFQAACRQHELLIADQAAPNPAHLASYVGLLLRHDQTDRATEWLEKLETMAPDNLGTVELRSRWLAAENRAGEIDLLVESAARRILEQIGDDKQQEAQLCLGIGNVYTAVQQHGAAERWYRRLFELSPERCEPLAMSLARQGRVADAIELCGEAAKTGDSPQPAVVLTQALLIGKPSAEDYRLAEPLLSQAAENHGEDAAVLFRLANVRIAQGQVDQAVTLYRKVLQLAPQHVTALNNAATLLAERPDDRPEALRYIDRAIDIVGPQPMLLDTKAVILYYLGSTSEAIALLESAAASLNADPRYHFHLAVAYYDAKAIDKAKAAYRKAREGGLENQILTESDQTMLKELEQNLHE
ncbi:MAG: tetratricopeptide repeat protein [Pirellulales bacterium]|nr:tetratricopeptide repeat protein [Pirellulales bacterium]